MVDLKTTTLLITGTAHGLVHLLMLALPYITTKLLEVTAVPPGQDWVVVLLLNTPAYFIFGFGAVPAGFLCDRIGPTRTIALGLLLSVISGISLFFLWPLGLMTIAALFVLYSFGAGLYHPAGTAWVSKTFIKNRGKALGRHGIGGSIGQASSPIISAFILSTVFWPVIFIFLALVGVIVAFVCLRVRYHEAELEEPASQVKETGNGFFSKMTVAVFLIVVIVLVTRGMFYRGTVTALPTYLNRELMALLILAGFFGTLIYVGGMVGQEVGGRLTDGFGWKKTLVMTSCLSGFSLVLLALPYSSTPFNDGLLILAVLLFGFSYFAAQAATNTMVASLSTPENRGAVFGLSFFARFGFGAFGIPIMSYGFLLYGTWTIGFFILALLILLSAGFALFVNPRNQNGEEVSNDQ